MRSIPLVLLLFLFTLEAASQNWIRASGVPSGPVIALAEHRGSLLAANDTCVYIGSADGNAWTASAPLPGMTSVIQTLHSGGDKVFAGTLGDGVYVSTDSGRTWNALSDGLSGWARRIVEFAELGDSLYAATDGAGVYVLDLLHPARWQPFNNGILHESGVTIAATEDHLIYGTGISMFVRHRTGSAWSAVMLDSSAAQRAPLRIHASGGYLFAGTATGIYRGARDGQSWRALDIPFLRNIPVSTFTTDGDRLYVSLPYHNEHFICSTDDMGATWDFRAHELVPLYALRTAYGRMWTGREDGLWSMDLQAWPAAVEHPAKAPSEFSLSQNYPNPFNPSTTIAFTLPARAFALLEIFDNLGRKVATPLEAMLDAGHHQLQLSAGGLAGGLYFYRLRAGTEMLTRKFLLVK